MAPDADRELVVGNRWLKPLVAAALIAALTLGGWVAGRMLSAKRTSVAQGPKPSPSNGSASQPARPASGPPQRTVPTNPEIAAMRDEAITVLEQLERDFPDQPAVLNSVASLYALWAMDAEADERFRRCIRLDPASAKPKQAMGIAALMRGDNEEAIRNLREALTLDPALPMARLRLGEAMVNAGRMEEAVKELDRYATNFPNSTEGLFRLGQAHFHLREYAKAKENQERVIRLDPSYAQAYHALANACEAMGLREECEKHRRRFAELGRRDPDPGRTYRERIDDMDLAQGNLAETHLAAARVYQAAPRRSGQRDWMRETEEHLRAAARASRKDRQSRVMLVNLYDQTNRLQEAVDVLNELVVLDPKEPLHYVNRGILLARLGQLGAAEKDFRQAIDLAPDLPDGHAKLALLLLRKGTKLTEARESARTAARLAPRDAEHHALLAETCAALDDRAAAQAALRRAVELDPNNPRVQRAKAKLDSK